LGSEIIRSAICLDIRQNTAIKRQPKESIIGDIPFKGQYSWFLFVSIFIARRLNGHSTAVVIGAMLIRLNGSLFFGMGLSLANDIEYLKAVIKNFA